MMDLQTIQHVSIVILIMIGVGWFGGYLNYLHNFDMNDGEKQDSRTKFKYVLLGIGSAFLVPAFMQMISSDLATSRKPDDYLIFSGFCLIAAIFSRRFINTIGDRILEAAKNAEKVAVESNQKAESTQLELNSTRERIEDVKLAVDISSTNNQHLQRTHSDPKQTLMVLANNYVDRTSIPDYSNRLKLKAELGRRMGEIIVRGNLNKDELIKENPSEGMLLAVAYAIQLRPSAGDIDTLKRISKLTNQLYTRYSILIAYDTLSRNGFIENDHVEEIKGIAKSFSRKADKGLLRKIDDTISILSIITE